jgi:hypothetical protein
MKISEGFFPFDAALSNMGPFVDSILAHYSRRQITESAVSGEAR